MTRSQFVIPLWKCQSPKLEYYSGQNEFIREINCFSTQRWAYNLKKLNNPGEYTTHYCTVRDFQKQILHSLENLLTHPATCNPPTNIIPPKISLRKQDFNKELILCIMEISISFQ